MGKGPLGGGCRESSRVDSNQVYLQANSWKLEKTRRYVYRSDDSDDSGKEGT